MQFFSPIHCLVLGVLLGSPVHALIGADEVKPFEDVTEKPGLKGISGGVAAGGDFDNDGWVDLGVGGEVWRNEGSKRVAVRLRSQDCAAPNWNWSA